jgi:hypothetical protein
MQLYEIMRKVKEVKPEDDQRFFNRKRKAKDPNPTFLAYFTAEFASNKQVTIRKFAHSHAVSVKTIHTTLHKDLNPSKKSARSVSRLLNEEMKKECVRTSKAFFVRSGAIPGDA